MSELNQIRALTKTRIEELDCDIGMSYRECKEMHKAICSDCGQECRVPFKPDPNRSVYCRDCWAKRRTVRN